MLNTRALHLHLHMVAFSLCSLSLFLLLCIEGVFALRFISLLMVDGGRMDLMGPLLSGRR
jgi:hypothetical protein